MISVQRQYVLVLLWFNLLYIWSDFVTRPNLQPSHASAKEWVSSTSEKDFLLNRLHGGSNPRHISQYSRPRLKSHRKGEQIPLKIPKRDFLLNYENRIFLTKNKTSFDVKYFRGFRPIKGGLGVIKKGLELPKLLENSQNNSDINIQFNKLNNNHNQQSDIFKKSKKNKLKYLKHGLASLENKVAKNTKNTKNAKRGVIFPTVGVAKEFHKHLIVTPRLAHGRNKRSIDSTLDENDNHIDHITIGVNLGERDVLLELQLNRDLIPEGYFERHIFNSSQTVHRPKSVGLCHYQGFVKDMPGSWAAISTCGGIRGVVFDGESLHYLEPIHGITTSATHPHYLLKHQDLIQQNLTCGYNGHPNHPVRDLFHDEDFSKLLRYKRDLSPTAPRLRGPFNADSLSRFVELVLVADKAEFEKYDSDADLIHQRFKDIANIVNALYQSLNIFIALVGVEVWQDKDQVEVSTDGDKTLTNFLNYRKVRLIPDHPNDNAQLLTGKIFDAGVVGKALKGPICTYQYSGGVNMDHSNSVALVATTVAHEMGHNFGMEHDTEEDCTCPDKRCIMAPSSGTRSPSHWSSCSHEYLAISFERSMDYCLRNRPTRLFGSPVCGNGFVEAGEQCDCGLPNRCENACCDAHTCMLFENATCATGHCCDLKTCRPREAGTECRSALYECDLPEFCSGDSEYCPEDFYKEDGQACQGATAYCYSGICRTHEHQCRLLWGPTGKNSDDKCYKLNLEGNNHGNCGYNWANNTYKKCQNRDVKCGMLHCKHFNERLEFGMESVSRVSHHFLADRGKGVIPCRVAQVDLGLDTVDPGLAPQGAKCGYNKMCVDQRCLEVSSLRNGLCDCNGHGTCNNVGHCHCSMGFAWPYCKYPGLGGSQDSGPVTNPNSPTSKFVVGLFVFFLGIVPIAVLSLGLVYYLKGGVSFLPYRKISRPAQRAVGVGGKLSPSSKSGSPLLSDGSTLASQLTEEPKIFGKFDGFTLTPIDRGEPDGEAPIGVPPGAWTPAEEPQSPIGNIGISGPSLMATTNTSVSAGKKNSNTINLNIKVNPLSPARRAPPRPRSVPDGASLISSVPTATTTTPSTERSKVSRMASSFLGRRPDGCDAPLSTPPSSQTLPRKASKIDRESLMRLKISSPQSLTATELPSNLVPVRPAPTAPLDPAAPKALSPNQTTKTIKVSWATPIDEEDAVLTRVGSVREPTVTPRPTVAKFGSMRVPKAPRPKSLPPPRPTQPPPRPPLPAIPAILDTIDCYYDDCVTVRIGGSPEGIYATIDEESPNEAPKKEKKGLFAMLYAKTKKKHKEPVAEPLYTNLATDEAKREDSTHTPSPVLVEEEDSGGLLSEIVTELATREPQYVNSLSDEGNKKSPIKSPEISPLRSAPAPPTTSLSVVSSQSPPYANVKPRGVFSYFKSSNSDNPYTVNTNNTNSNIKTSKVETTPTVGLKESLAEVKAASLATKKIAGKENPFEINKKDNPVESKVSDKKLSTESTPQPVKEPISPAISPIPQKTTSAKNRPAFPPDKVIKTSKPSSAPVGRSVVSEKTTKPASASVIGRNPTIERKDRQPSIGKGRGALSSLKKDQKVATKEAKIPPNPFVKKSLPVNTIKSKNETKDLKKDDKKGIVLKNGPNNEKMVKNSQKDEIKGFGIKSVPNSDKNKSSAFKSGQNKDDDKKLAKTGQNNDKLGQKEDDKTKILASKRTSSATPSAVSRSGVMTAAATGRAGASSNVASLQQKFERESEANKATNKSTHRGPKKV